METNNPDTEATLSLLESTKRESNISSLTNQVDQREQIERLKTQNRVLESENNELKRIQPRLIDAQGKDYTTEIANLVEELQVTKDSCENWEVQHRKLLKMYSDLEQNALEQIDQRDKEIRDIKRKALDLEEENSKLREQIQDEQSKIHHLQAGRLDKDKSLNELHRRDQIQNLTKVHAVAAEQLSYLNESLSDLNINDADQIAAHIFMILDCLEKNSKEAEDLQTSIFAFLADRGLNADAQKCSIYTKIYNEAIRKRKLDIRDAHYQLRTKCGNQTQDKEFESCMQQFSMQDSVSMNNTYPSFAAGAMLNQQREMSMAEQAVGPTLHNMTTESAVAVNLAGRTTDLAEACLRMFEKLRGTAEFFQNLLKTLGVNEDEVGGDLMRKIESMKLDLDKSLREAHSIMEEARNAEQNMRSILLEQSQAVMNATVYNTFNESKQMESAAVVTSVIAETQLSTVFPPGPSDDAASVECQQCKNTEQLYHTTKLTLDNELEKKEQMAQEIADKVEQNEKLQEEVVKLETKVQDLESRICEKCSELAELYNSAQSALDTEIAEKKEIAEKLDKLEELNKQLVEEKEQLSSSVKENIPRNVLVESIREEMGKIYDTMSFASSACNAASKSGQKGSNKKRPALTSCSKKPTSDDPDREQK